MNEKKFQGKYRIASSRLQSWDYGSNGMYFITICTGDCLHYVLKSGCRIEHLQLSSADRIKKALATYTIVAWRLLWLTYQARQNPELPCDTILETYEWQSLYCQIHDVPVPRSQPPSLEQAVIWIAQLGGFLARKHNGFPGVKSLWRGLSRLHDIASTWKRLHPSSHLSLKTYG